MIYNEKFQNNHDFLRIGDECEIFVDNDKSISRKHAVFSMEDVNVKQVLIQTQSDPIIRPILSLTDYSKYGTFVLKNGNYEKIGENNKIEIVDDTTIRFGVYESVYTYVYHELVRRRYLIIFLELLINLLCFAFQELTKKTEKSLRTSVKQLMPNMLRYGRLTVLTLL